MPPATTFHPTTEGSPRRILTALGISAFLHALLVLAIIFDVAGMGGGFGLGVGPGFGIGSGGGIGLGKEKRRQIFSIEEIPDLVQRPMNPDNEEALAELMVPRAPAPVKVPTPAKPVVKKAAVVQFARPVRPIGAGQNLGQRFAAAGASAGGLGMGGGGGGFGISLGSSSFRQYVTKLRGSGLDVAIVVDATGSMQNVIDVLKNRLDDLVSDMQRLVPTARIGAVAFRDKADDKIATAPRQSEDFVIKWSDLTLNGKKVKTFLNGIVAEGGGDWEEAVKEGVEAAMTRLKWRPDAKKVIIIVGSSPPHAKTMPELRSLVSQWRSKNGVISTIDVSERLHEEHERKIHKWLYGDELQDVSPLPEFYAQVKASYGEIASAGGGQSIALGKNDAIMQHLLVMAFGSQWRKEVSRAARRSGG
jgi:hypothetical protein